MKQQVIPGVYKPQITNNNVSLCGYGKGICESYNRHRTRSSHNINGDSKFVKALFIFIVIGLVFCGMVY